MPVEGWAARWAGRLLPRLLALGDRPVVLVDGGSGSGKSTLARALADAWPGGATLVRLDDLYPGWDGLEAGSAQVHAHVLAPRAAGRPARWRRWDWVANRPAEWQPVDAELPLVVEGSGVLSTANAALADFAVWIELDEPTRKQRALARDGDAYKPHWERWAAQERAFAERERPAELADLVIDESAD